MPILSASVKIECENVSKVKIIVSAAIKIYKAIRFLEEFEYPALQRFDSSKSLESKADLKS